MMTTKFRFPRRGDRFGKMPERLAAVELKFASTEGEFDEDGRLLLTGPLAPPPRPPATVPPPPPVPRNGIPPVRPLSANVVQRPRPSFPMHERSEQPKPRSAKPEILPDDIPW
ncbi:MULTISPECIES: hypothetical protein [Bradyrhizobium]|uniref:hypothetical protein n=1 Tax=Bradyrhizobium TaxID=374 RepID=UPI001EDC9028|nr:hypothetical protein [Bradyrhizobium zhengyangense]MCG2645707.1 hypothetical protein [Bradyrhizobium zhengyangense]